MKRFACQDIIPGCNQVFTGADDQSVLDQVMAHAAADHGLVKPPLALVELVVATTRHFTPTRPRGHLRLVGAQTAVDSEVSTVDALLAGPEEGAAANFREPAVEREPPAFPERVGATIPFQRRGETRRNIHSTSSDSWPASTAETPWLRPVHDSYRHECVFYEGVDGFCKAVVPFILDGLSLDQPVMVAVAEPRLTAVRKALGDDARRVVLLDMAELGGNPASIIPAWRDFVAGTHGRPIRGVGEPIWAGRRDVEIVEAQLHEALLNVAVDPDTPLWLMCPYDFTTLDQQILDEAERSHPYLGGLTSRSDAAAKQGGAHYTPHAMSLFAATLPEPSATTVTISADAGSIGDLATEIFDAAAAAGLSAQRSAKLAAAVDEVANAGSRNSGAPVSIRLWQEAVRPGVRGR